uniref:Uncharacterized protein n=1 Tax=Biomphalaria glabrata TaxID=6526 RepID=A0A2C9KFF5_BIOGL
MTNVGQDFTPDPRIKIKIEIEENDLAQPSEKQTHKLSTDTNEDFTLQLKKEIHIENEEVEETVFLMQPPEEQTQKLLTNTKRKSEAILSVWPSEIQYQERFLKQEMEEIPDNNFSQTEEDEQQIQVHKTCQKGQETLSNDFNLQIKYGIHTTKISHRATYVCSGH